MYNFLPNDILDYLGFPDLNQKDKDEIFNELGDLFQNLFLTTAADNLSAQDFRTFLKLNEQSERDDRPAIDFLKKKVPDFYWILSKKIKAALQEIKLK